MTVTISNVTSSTVKTKTVNSKTVDRCSGRITPDLCASMLLLLGALTVAVGLLPTTATGLEVTTGDEDTTVAPRIPKDHEEVQQMIFFAVLEGLYRDGVSTETAQLLVSPGENGSGLRYFVYACPICIPAVDALTVYAARADFPHRKRPENTFGKGWSEERLALLRDEDPRVRIDAVQAIILESMNRRLSDMRLTAFEQEKWTSWLGALREKGNARLESYLEGGGPWAETYRGWEKCGACEGAAGAMQP